MKSYKFIYYYRVCVSVPCAFGGQSLSSFLPPWVLCSGFWESSSGHLGDKCFYPSCVLITDLLNLNKLFVCNMRSSLDI